MLLFFAVCASFAAGPQVLTFRSAVDDSEQPYALYLPKAFDPSHKYPLVVSLHDENSNHRLNLRRVFGRGNLPLESDAEASRRFPPFPDVDFIVVSPFARGALGYQGIGETDVYEAIADVTRRYPIDADRVYLTGISAGGAASLWLGLTRPDRWAAIAPVCPAADPQAEALTPNALNIPIHLFHGDQDPLVPVAVSRGWHKRLLALGAKADYMEYPGVRHNAWDHAYKGASIFDWFSPRRRDRMPARVTFVTSAYKYNAAYWLECDALTPGTPASIDARFTKKNQLEITTANLDGFTLKLTGHPQFGPTPLLTVRIDGAVLKTRPAAVLGFNRTAKGWRVGRYRTAPGSKRAGAEGPLAEAIAARHIYVYGTADSPGAEELERRRQTAAHAAEWSTPRARLPVSFAVKADRDVTADEAANANLVLFGVRETNHLIARFAPALPLALNPGAADYGLAFIYPEGGRYLVVNSGRPWWTGAEEAGRIPPRSLPLPFRVLQGLGDFIVFKGSLENVIVEGRFDRDWKLSPAAAAKLGESGTIVLQ